MNNGDYLKELNPVQRQAVEQIKGPVIIVAGAGSGKTRVLTYRIAHMIKKGIDPFNILSLTFTNKAAKEMRNRIEKIVGKESKSITMGTFHSVFSKILRINADKIGYTSDFTIYDHQDSKNLIKTIVKDFGLSDKEYKPNNVQYRISMAKNNLIGPDAYSKNPSLTMQDESINLPMISDIYKEYSKRCFRASAMDFDDLLYKMYVLIQKNLDVKNYYSNKFKYILVDEYQDTNRAQYIIVKELAKVFENICVVGDDAQSIYNFRGADISNILDFKKDYSDCKEFKLEENYRSTQNIVEVSNSVIKFNKNQIDKTLFSSKSKGKPITVFSAPTDREEATITVNKIIKNKINLDLKYKDIAIFYRTNNQSRALEEALRRNSVPYRVYGGLSFYDRKEIKDAMAYFKLVINPKDDESLKRIINFPKRGIGQTSINKILIYSNENNLNVWSVISKIKELKLDLPSGTIKKINEFYLMIKKFNQIKNEEDAYILAHDILKESSVLTFYGGIDKSPDEISRHENIKELLNGVRNYVDSATTPKEMQLSSFVNEVSLLTDFDKEEDENHVSLMTIHSSKGLEFPMVFINGVEENLFPSSLSVSSREDLEEERRLFYVAITRAEKYLYISYSESRFKWGSLQFTEPSRFLEEIEESYLNYELHTEKTPKEKINPKKNIVEQYKGFYAKKTEPQNLVKAKNINLNSGNISLEEKIKEGSKVKHLKFGAGYVVEISGNKGEKKALINFDKVGSKIIFIKYSKIEILE